jgi:hypothetical protein
MKTEPGFNLYEKKEKSEHGIVDMPSLPYDRSMGARPRADLLGRNELVPATWVSLAEGTAALLDGGNLPQRTISTSAPRKCNS